MRAPNWYVIQVETGREQQACDSILRAARQHDHRRQQASDDDTPVTPLLRECFTPRYRGRYKLHGQWHDEDRLLLPGYVIADVAVRNNATVYSVIGNAFVYMLIISVIFLVISSKYLTNKQ